MKNRFLLLLLLFCTFGLVRNSEGQSVATWEPHWGDIPIIIGGGANMTLSVAIYIDGEKVNNANYEIAPFQEGCTDQYDAANNEYGRTSKIGAKPIANTAGDYFYNVLYFGYDDPFESASLNRVTFKIFDHETNTVLDATSTYEWDYWANAIWGSASHPLPLHFYTQETQWELVEDASTLADGDIIMITNEDTDVALGEDPTSNDRLGWDIVNENGNITWENPIDDYAVQEILVRYESELSTENPTFFASKGYLSAAASQSTRKWLKTTMSANNNSVWTITITDGIAEIVAESSQYTNNNLCYDDGNLKFICASSQTNPVRIYRKVIATEPTQFTVNATASPADAGSIQVEGADFTTGTYDEGTTLSLTAVPAEGMQFDHWTVNGTEAGNTNPLEVTVDGDKDIIAYFEAIPVTYYTLTTSVDPAEAGTITITPEPGENGYEAGTSITVTATGADNTWFFDQWVNEAGEAVYAVATYTFEINENTTLVAQFHQEIPVNYYTLTVNVDPVDAGTYTLSPEPGDQGYEEGTEVTVTAVANEGYSFVEWQNAIDETIGNEAAYTFTISANTTLFAIFEAVVVVEPHTVTFVAGSGNCDVTTLTEAEGGAGITLPEATPCDAAITAGYTFAGWATAEVAETTTAPELFNGTYAPEADITLYAVYMMGGQAYTFKNGENYLNWNPAGNGNTLNVATEITDYSRWNVSFKDDNIVVMSPVAQDVAREIAWNNSSPRFATYKVTSLYNSDGALSNTYRAVSLFKDGAAVNSIAENDVVLLVSDAAKKELDALGNYGTGADYEEVPAGLYPLTVGVDGEPAVYNTNPSCEGPVVTQDPVFENVPATITTSSVMVEISCPTEGAVIYYTVDGTDPTAESTVYTAPFEIFETTTVKAIAIVEGGEPSNVVSQTYTFPSYTIFENIAAFKAAYDATSTDMAMITGDVTFVFRNGRYMYVQDETAGLLIYDNNNPVITNTYENGDVISGGIIGTMNVYNGQKELVPAANPAEGVAGTAVEPTVVTAADVIANYADYDAKFVKMVEVTFTEDHTFNNTSAGRTTTFNQGEATYTVYNRFNNLDITVSAEQQANVTGFIGIFNDTKQMYPRDNEDIELIAPEPEMVTITATANPAVGGTVEGAQEYEVGATVTLTATAAEGYTFVNWTEGETILGTDATLTFTAEIDRDLVANFEEVVTPPEPEMVTITVTIDPENSGTVSGAGEYQKGIPVLLSATAAEGFEFWQWMEGTTILSSEPNLSFTAETNRDLIAMFKLATPEPEMVTINATANPAVGGTIEGAGEYEVGTEVTLTATAAEGYTFVNWTEGETILGTDATLTFTAEIDRDLVANFEEVVTPPEPEMVTINATANPAIGGTVSGADTYEVGATVTLNATPAEGYHFVSWTEDDAFVTSNATYTFTAEIDRDLVANFEEDAPVEPDTYTITVLETENGVVTAPATAQEGAEVTIEAVAAPLHILASLYYYTTDPEDVTAIDLETMTFEMPAADVTIGAEFASVASLGDANNDGDVNILDVLCVLNYILGKNPQPFDFEQADMNADGVIDISDAMAINALIHGMKADCGEQRALYDVVDGILSIESEVALAGYQFSLSAEPASIELEGFTTMGNWVNGEYILVVFNLNAEKEAGLYEVLNIGDAQVNHVALATLNGCKVNAERGTLSVNSLEATFNVYPVPAKEVVTVEGNGIVSIDIFNVMGQRVMTAHTNEVNVSNLAAGTYMFRINTENGQVTKNVVVVK